MYPTIAPSNAPPSLQAIRSTNVMRGRRGFPNSAVVVSFQSPSKSLFVSLLPFQTTGPNSAVLTLDGTILQPLYAWLGTEMQTASTSPPVTASESKPPPCSPPVSVPGPNGSRGPGPM